MRGGEVSESTKEIFIWEDKNGNVLKVLTILYGCGAWAFEKAMQRRDNAFEIKCLRTVSSVKWLD